MSEFNELLQRLRKSSRITLSSFHQGPRQQGAYILWLDNNPPVCLKVGIAGPRKGEGLRGRLQLHFSSNPDNTVLAKHMEADRDSVQAQRHDFRDREQRQQFLANECFFQAIPLPNWTRKELRRFENFLESRLSPRYKGRVSRI